MILFLQKKNGIVPKEIQIKEEEEEVSDEEEMEVTLLKICQSVLQKKLHCIIKKVIKVKLKIDNSMTRLKITFHLTDVTLRFFYAGRKQLQQLCRK